MSEVVKKIDQIPESYSPKVKPEILKTLELYNLSFKEKFSLLPKSNNEPPKSSKIENIHRIYFADKSENFMLDGCLRGLLEALGESAEYDYNLMMALSGDMFTQMYNKDAPTDCLSDNCFIPEAALNALKICGYESVFFTKDEIKEYQNDIIPAIKDSITRKIPVISIGVANVPRTTPGDQPIHVPYASIIGGYDNDDLLVNVWIEDALTEENGYAKAKNALDNSDGLLMVVKKISKPALSDVYRDILNCIPIYLTLKPRKGYKFAKEAFYEWADNIKNNEILKYADKWNLHFAPAVILYTNTPRARNFVQRVTEICPDFELAGKLLPIFEKAVELNRELDKTQGGFDFDAGRFTEEEFNSAHTNILYQLGDLQDEILNVYKRVDL